MIKLPNVIKYFFVFCDSCLVQAGGCSKQGGRGQWEGRTQEGRSRVAHPVHYQKTLTKPFVQRSPQLRGALLTHEQNC